MTTVKEILTDETFQNVFIELEKILENRWKVTGSMEARESIFREYKALLRVKDMLFERLEKEIPSESLLAKLKQLFYRG